MAAVTPLLFLAQLWVAQAPPFGDDFETGTLFSTESPPGQWTDWATPEAGNSFQPVAAAAHRGALGLRFIDVTPDVGSAYGSEVYVTFTSAAPELFARAWLKVSPSTSVGSGQIELFTIANAKPNNADTMNAISVIVADGGIFVPGDVIGGELGGIGQCAFIMNAWHLVELVIRNTAGVGYRKLAVDGEVCEEMANLNWSTSPWAAKLISIGQNWQEDMSFTGTIDFDDVRADVKSLASRLSLTGPSMADTGTCVLLELSFLDSWSDAGVPVPYDAPVGIGVNGAALFSDDRCTVGATEVTVRQGARSGTFWLKGTNPGSAVVSASYVDFLPATFSLIFNQQPFQSDAGVPDAGVEPRDAGAVEGNDGGLPSDGGATEVSDAGTSDESRGKTFRFASSGCSSIGTTSLSTVLVLLLTARRRLLRPLVHSPFDS